MNRSLNVTLIALILAIGIATTFTVFNQPAQAMWNHFKKDELYIHYYDAYDNFCWHKHYEGVSPISSYHYNTSGQHGYGGNLAHHQSHGEKIVKWVLEFETVYYPGDCP